MKQTTHSLERTSPMGEKFVGVCVLCQTPNLTMGDALKPCANPGKVSSDDALLDALGPDSGGTE